MHLFEIKCPHSRQPADFQQLPQHIEAQVLTQLAVIHSHNLPPFQKLHAAVFFWFADQPPITHHVDWARGGGRRWRSSIRRGNIFPLLQRCSKLEWGPALRVAEHVPAVQSMQQVPLSAVHCRGLVSIRQRRRR